MRSPSHRIVTRRRLLAAGAGAAAVWWLHSSTLAQAEASPVLARLLAENRKRSPEYGGGLANHMSMALVALHGLGADDARLQEYADRHARRLEPLPEDPGGEVPEDWSSVLGRPGLLVPFRRRFDADIAKRGRAAVLGASLPRLASGIATAAFHCVIRTAYAVDCGDDAELAFALAYFASYHHPLPRKDDGSEVPKEALAPLELLARARTTKSLAGKTLKGNLIIDVMDQAAVLPGIATVTDPLALDVDTHGRIAHAALRLYLATNSFTALHLVTSTHALRVLAPFVADPMALLRPFWRAVAIAYVGLGTPEIPGEDPALPKDAADWSKVAAAATKSNDDHVVKLALTCSREEQAWRDPLYRLAAARKAGV